VHIHMFKLSVGPKETAHVIFQQYFWRKKQSRPEAINGFPVIFLEKQQGAVGKERRGRAGKEGFIYLDHLSLAASNISERRVEFRICDGGARNPRWTCTANVIVLGTTTAQTEATHIGFRFGRFRTDQSAHRVSPYPF
jgi:hypothetical protein